MNAIAGIVSKAAEANLPFLLAGGHAVIAHGHTRNTFDLDLIIRRSDGEKWTGLVGELGYTLHSQGPNFRQFNPPNERMLPLDLMLMNEETFSKLAAEAVPAPASAGGARTVSLLHLLALKCHAIKHGHKGCVVKDAEDVIQLVQINRLDVRHSNIREIFLKYAQPNCMKKSKASADKAELSELEFPDWSGMHDSSQRVSPDAAFQLCEQYPAWFPEQAKRSRLRRTEKCVVEFTL